ncbi:orotidine-5'-phosphate decarboxylase [Mobilicoccus pelagius]|uniref:Orotidine 5'-phosphate decarboxylase n=1 Tax=Mobilicoccus pelagius NBRC 104925 TaxID=1089455 RepID=H5UV11_9MICO|nr:orotidine-5'-phosphate decarboxylase [Mobilicoccus pelagius]GAB49569.1 orotidine 5'-phosphate decarboxylase [Mobilicoccus pelagius NBRC 104925]
MTPFGARLSEAMDTHGPLCAGIDPHAGLLQAWGLADDVDGLATFASRCVEAFAGTVACVKPQSAFFERFGSAGVAVLEKTLADLREAGTLAILDVKRGDIGSTMGGYAQAYLGESSPLRADAITVSPYLGYGSLRPALDLAAEQGRGVFVLALTSNPEGASVQHASRAGEGGKESVAGSVVAGVTADNVAAAAEGRLGSVGMVVGATIGSAVSDLGLDLAAANAPLLAPGVGAQGATAEDLRAVFGAALPAVLASSSRDVLSAGPDVAALRERARTVADGVRAMVAS